MTSDLVREAVAAGDYSGAAALFHQYARSLPLDGDSLADLTDLVNWTRATVRCAQAHREEELRQLRAGIQVAAAYART
jgi:hypothetical protein